MNIAGIFKSIAHFFSSPAAQAVEKAIENAVIDAQPLVAAISLAVPNRTFQAVAQAYANYAVPFAMSEAQMSDPTQQGLALRDLATAVLKKNHQNAGANVLNAAVELALASNSAK